MIFIVRLCILFIDILSFYVVIIELKNNKLHGLLPPGGSVSPPGGFSSLYFDQGVP
jgi:hypothetical protein